MKQAQLTKVLCKLFGHREVEIRHTMFYGTPPQRDPQRSISTYKCKRCNNIRTHEINYK